MSFQKFINFSPVTQNTPRLALLTSSSLSFTPISLYFTLLLRPLYIELYFTLRHPPARTQASYYSFLRTQYPFNGTKGWGKRIGGVRVTEYVKILSERFTTRSYYPFLETRCTLLKAHVKGRISDSSKRRT